MRVHAGLRTAALVAALALGVGLALGAAGCGKKSADATYVCTACGVQVAAADVQIIDDHPYCPSCAAKIESAQTADQGQVEAGAPGAEVETDSGAARAGQATGGDSLITCSVCGMKMTAAETKMIDGKAYCVHCAPAQNAPKAPAGGRTGHGG